jgi:hypothetical protein
MRFFVFCHEAAAGFFQDKKNVYIPTYNNLFTFIGFAGDFYD